MKKPIVVANSQMSIYNSKKAFQEQKQKKPLTESLHVNDKNEFNNINQKKQARLNKSITTKDYRYNGKGARISITK